MFGTACRHMNTDLQANYQIGVHETCSRALLLALLPGRPQTDPLEGNDVYEAALNLVIGLESLLRWHRKELVWHSIASHLKILSLMASSPSAARSVDAVLAGDAALDVISAVLQQKAARTRFSEKDTDAGPAEEDLDGSSLSDGVEGLSGSSHLDGGDDEDGYWRGSGRREAREGQGRGE